MSASRILLKTLIALSAALCCLPVAYAQEDPAKAPAAAVAPLDPALEGAGLYKKAADGSFGKDMWSKTPRPVVAALLKSMPARSSNPAVQTLVFGALLSEFDPARMEENAPPAPGDDLLSLRLAKLIEGGAYRQALELYSSLNMDSPPESAAQSGILAMLYTGQKSLACLEIKTLGNNFSASDFFRDLSAFCDATSDSSRAESKSLLAASKFTLLKTLEDAPASWRFMYDPAAYDKLAPLERALLAAEGKLDIPAAERGDFKNLPPQDLQIVMNAPGLSDKDKFILNVRALEWGLISAADLKKTYLSVIKPDNRLDPDLAPPAGAEDWQKLPFFLQIAMNKKSSAEKWNAMQPALEIGRRYGIASLLPFADILSKIEPPESPDFQDLRAGMTAMIYAGYAPPPAWVRSIEKYKPAPAETRAYAAMLAAAQLSNPDDDQKRADFKAIFSYLGDQDKKYGYLLENVIEIVDNYEFKEHTPKSVYENYEGLTFNSDYVMPTVALWNRLPQAGHEGHIGETILLAAAALRDAPPGKIYPGVLAEALRSLNDVGLTDISRNLALWAALGDERL